MKIDPEHLPRVGKEPTRVGGPAKRAPVREARASDPAQAADKSNADGLTLSAGADRFRQLRVRLETLPEPKQSERVARLKALVDAGEYKVDAEKIARAMLADDATASALGFDPSG
jgi:negative regulator of flagellin synthesis FlgM